MASKVTTEGNTTDLEIKTDLDVQNSQQPAIVEDIEGTGGVEEANPRTSCDDAVTVESNEGDAMGAAERENLAAVKKSKLLEGISQYRRAVENTKVHSVLLKEKTITTFLVVCLGEDAPEVVEKSYEVFRILSRNEENLLMLKNTDYIMDALRSVRSNTNISDGTRQDAKDLIKQLKSLSVKNPPLTELSESMKNVLASALVTATVPDGVNKKPADLNTTLTTLRRKNKGRETILFVDNDVLQNKEERATVTQALIRVAGIISVTYDLKKNHVIVRGKRNVASEDFARAVASLELANVFLVRKNENKEEIKILIEVNVNQHENVLYPPYPDEQENEVFDNSAAVAKNGQVADDDSSFFNSAKKFLKRSFYW